MVDDDALTGLFTAELFGRSGHGRGALAGTSVPGAWCCCAVACRGELQPGFGSRLPGLGRLGGNKQGTGRAGWLAGLLNWGCQREVIAITIQHIVINLDFLHPPRLVVLVTDPRNSP